MTLQISEKIQAELAKIDLVVFDVDGVLIDTKPSFVATIPITAKFYINNILNLPINLDHISIDDAFGFKGFSGFNNDWNLTTSLVIYILLNYRLSKDPFTRENFLTRAGKYNAGLDGIYELLKIEVRNDIEDWVLANAEHDKIRKVFREIYAGKKYCNEIYGFDPVFDFEIGTIANEKVLMDIELAKKWTGKTGILTGRACKELEIAIDMIGFDDLDEALVEYSGNGLPDKPDPAKMVKIINNAGCRNTLYIGDTLDDYLTVVNYNNLPESERSSRVIFGLVRDEQKIYPAEALEFSANSVNELLEVVIA